MQKRGPPKAMCAPMTSLFWRLPLVFPASIWLPVSNLTELLQALESPRSPLPSPVKDDIIRSRRRLPQQEGWVWVSSPVWCSTPLSHFLQAAHLCNLRLMNKAEQSEPASHFIVKHRGVKNVHHWIWAHMMVNWHLNFHKGKTMVGRMIIGLVLT